MRISLLIFTGIIFISGNSPKEKLKEAPPGTTWLKDNLFIDQAPIRNIDYLEYEYVMRRCKFSIECWKAYGDSLIKFNSNYTKAIKSLVDNCKPNSDSLSIMIFKYSHLIWGRHFWGVDEYLNNPKYQNYPCININYETAIAYCEFRTQAVLMDYGINKKSKHYSQVKYRLPTQEEWEYALLKYKNLIPSPSHKIDSSCVVRQCFTNKNKLYQLSNISEMVFEKGFAKGISWKDSTINDINYTTNYTDYADWLGFRCICEVSE